MRTRVVWLKRWSSSGIDYLRYVYGSEWKYAVGLVGFALSLVVMPLPDGVTAAVFVVGLVLSLALLVHDSAEIFRRWRRGRLVPLPGHAADPGRPFTGAQWRSDRPDEQEILTFAGVDGPTGDAVWVDFAVNAELADCARQRSVSIDRTPFRLPDDLREIAPLALRVTASSRLGGSGRRRRPLWFNGQLARLTTEPTLEALESSSFRFQRVSYYDGQASNELWHWGVPGVEAEPVGLAWQHGADLQDRILALGQSRLAHIVGVSVLAITADDQIVFVRQSQRNSVDPGGIVVSASGSLDWADVAGGRQAAPTLHEALMAGMLRELGEESGVRAGEVVPGSERVTGYFRWLSRGAKPEFTGIVTLSIDAAELVARKIDAAERIFTRERILVPGRVLREAAASAGAQRWGTPVDALERHLRAPGSPMSPKVLGTSSLAAWHAAVALLARDARYPAPSA